MARMLLGVPLAVVVGRSRAGCSTLVLQTPRLVLVRTHTFLVSSTRDPMGSRVVLPH